MFESNETLEQARERNIRDALAEDIGRGDWTAMLVPAAQRVRARVIVREAAVLCGRDWFDGCVKALDPDARIAWAADEGARLCGRHHAVRDRGESPRTALGRTSGAEFPATALGHRDADARPRRRHRRRLA